MSTKNLTIEQITEIATQAAVAAVAAALQAQAPAKAAPKAQPKAAKAKPQPKADRPTAGVKYLCRATRQAFIAASEYDFTGWSTQEIAAWCVEAEYAPKGFGIGPAYLEMFSA